MGRSSIRAPATRSPARLCSEAGPLRPRPAGPELPEEAPPPPPPPPEPAELTLPLRLLTRADVEEWSAQAGSTRTYAIVPLPETAPAVIAGSESVHYKAQDSTQTWDAAL